LRNCDERKENSTAEAEETIEVVAICGCDRECNRQCEVWRLTMEATPSKADKADILANELAPLSMEGGRADLSDPRGYGNCFVQLWQWISGKVKGKQ
jgi:hypothetical protein